MLKDAKPVPPVASQLVGDSMPPQLSDVMNTVTEFDKYVVDHLSWAPRKEDLTDDDIKLGFFAGALCGEAGELWNNIKKDWRGDSGREERRQKIVKEVYDCCNYVFMVARHLGISPHELLAGCVDKFKEVQSRPAFQEARKKRDTAHALEPELRKNLDGSYMNEEQIVADIIARIHEENALDGWMEVAREDLGTAHHGTGKHIRNTYGLWRPDNPHFKTVTVVPNKEGVIDDPLFPDQASHRIMEMVWDVLHDEKHPYTYPLCGDAS